MRKGCGRRYSGRAGDTEIETLEQEGWLVRRDRRKQEII